MGSSEITPFKQLGEALRSIRLKFKESEFELSSAIEVEPNKLALFESGLIRPTEDILELLISHYRLDDREADKLWNIAGYNKHSDSEELDAGADKSKAQTVFVTPFDARIVYTDMVHVSVNDYGVIMNFMQGAGPNNNPLAVSRIGMSREHAKSVIEVLQKTLEQADKPKQPPKLLNSPESGTE